MADPTTVNKLLAIPTRGSDSGTWDLPVNGNSNGIDGMFGGFTSISLTNTNVTLTAPSGTTSPGAGPTQSQNALISASGTLTGNVAVIFPLPGFYIFANLCTVGSFYVLLSAPGAGNSIGAPPGEQIQIFSDGTNVYYVGLGRVGTYQTYAVTAVPAWITACTIPPYLLCNGGTFSSVTYPFLYQMLGNSNVLPDAQGRAMYSLNGGTGRITSGGNSIDGNTLFAGGGTQIIGAANLPNTSFPVTDPGHSHVLGNAGTFAIVSTGSNAATGGVNKLVALSTLSTNPAQTGVTVSSGGSGTQIASPGFVGGLTFIRAA